MKNYVDSDYCVFFHRKNPYESDGGIEKYIISQVDELNSKRIKTMILFPIKKTFANGKVIDFHCWGVIVDRIFRGTCTSEQFVDYMCKIEKKGLFCQGIMIHSLLKMNLDELELICNRNVPKIMYIHDFGTCCKQFNLRKNDEIFCGNAVLDKEKCSNCCYYSESLDLYKDNDLFFGKLSNIIFVTPSQYVKELWCEAYPQYQNFVITEGHVNLKGQYTDNSELLNSDSEIRVAFLGLPSKAKGYDIWQKFIKEIMDCKSNHISFYHLGMPDKSLPDEKYIRVSVRDDGEDAMIRTLRKLKIHVAVLFTTGPETYSFTYYESLASNVYVVTNNVCGNVMREVLKRGNGCVLECSDKALVDYFSNREQLIADINAYRKKRMAPLNLVPNLFYLELLQKEHVSVSEEITKKRRFNLNCVLAFILYSLLKK